MAAPVQPQPGTGQKMGFGTATALAIALLWAALIGSEKRVYIPYLDVFNVATVCAGIIGKAVIWGKTYTDAECDALEQNYIDGMLKRMGACVTRTDLELWQVIAWGHFAFNSGDGVLKGFCGSTAAKLLNAGKDADACEQMLRWTWGTNRKTGKRVNCAVRFAGCWGLYTRRLRERAMCNGDMDAFKPTWEVPA